MAQTGFCRLEAQIIKRSEGRSAIAASAYRARTALADERLQTTYDYTRHGNKALFDGFYAPTDAPQWARQRETFWNAVEQRESRRDSQLAKDFMCAFPHEMSVEHARYALQDFIKENFTRKGIAADLAIHEPHEHGDDRNKHAHILVSMRKLENGQWVDRKEQFGKDPATGKYRGPDSDELKHLRERMAFHFNRQLERFGYDVRVDLRSYEARGIQQEPGLHLGKRDAAKERAGVPTKRGDINREIKARNYSQQHIMDEFLRQLAQAQQGQTPISAPPPEVPNMAEKHPVEKAMERFEGAVGAIFDLTFGRGGDGVKDSSAEQYPGQGNKITLNVDTMNVRNVDSGQQPEQVAPTLEHEPPSISNAAAHEEAQSLDAAKVEAQTVEAQKGSEDKYYASRDEELRAYYESLEREQREHELERDRDR